MVNLLEEFWSREELWAHARHGRSGYKGEKRTSVGVIIDNAFMMNGIVE